MHYNTTPETKTLIYKRSIYALCQSAQESVMGRSRDYLEGILNPLNTNTIKAQMILFYWHHCADWEEDEGRPSVWGMMNSMIDSKDLAWAEKTTAERFAGCLSFKIHTTLWIKRNIHCFCGKLCYIHIWQNSSVPSVHATLLTKEHHFLSCLLELDLIFELLWTKAFARRYM